MRIAYIGFTVGLIPGYEKFLPPVQAPANYKDEVKIAEFIRAGTAKLAAEACWEPMTGRIEAQAIIDSATGTFADFKDPLISLQQFDVVLGFQVGSYLNLALAAAADAGTLDMRSHWAKLGSLSRLSYLTPHEKQKVVADPASILAGPYEPDQLPMILARFGLENPIPAGLPSAQLATHLALACHSFSRKIGFA